MNGELIISVISLIITQLGLYFKLIKEQNKKIQEKNVEQDKQLKELQDYCNEVDSRFLIFEKFIKNISFEKKLRGELVRAYYSVISANPDVAQNSDFTSLIIQARNYTLEFAIICYENRKEINKNELKVESDSVFDMLKMQSNQYIKGFAKYLRSHSELSMLINILIDRVIKNNLNDESFIKLFVEFYKNSVISGIVSYRKYLQSDEYKL